MKRTSRRAWAGCLLLTGVVFTGLVGCSGSGGRDGAPEALGQINLPLTTQGASGVTYRLRGATFVVTAENDYYEAEAGAAGSSGTITVSSDSDPNAKTISLSLQEGYYNVQLNPGWSMEKQTSAGSPIVEATLLSGASQWVYVSRQSTSWAEFSFGIGGKEVWLNGKLNIAIDVQETPGGGGEGGEGPIDIAVGGSRF